MEFVGLFLTISTVNHSGRNGDTREMQLQIIGFGKCFLHVKGGGIDLLTRSVIIPQSEHKFPM